MPLKPKTSKRLPCSPIAAWGHQYNSLQGLIGHTLTPGCQWVGCHHSADKPGKIWPSTAPVSGCLQWTSNFVGASMFQMEILPIKKDQCTYAGHVEYASRDMDKDIIIIWPKKKKSLTTYPSSPASSSSRQMHTCTNTVPVPSLSPRNAHAKIQPCHGSFASAPSLLVRGFAQPHVHCKPLLHLPYMACFSANPFGCFSGPFCLAFSSLPSPPTLECTLDRYAILPGPFSKASYIR